MGSYQNNIKIYFKIQMYMLVNEYLVYIKVHLHVHIQIMIIGLQALILLNGFTCNSVIDKYIGGRENASGEKAYYNKD